MISVGEIMSHRNQIKSDQLLRHQATLLPTNVSEDRYLYYITGSAYGHAQVEANRLFRLGHQAGTISPSCPSGFPALVPQEKFFTDPVGSLRTVIVEYSP